ncbi:MAG: YggT family protein [Anaerovoracaceae bacterium]|jgi:YggT family protein
MIFVLIRAINTFVRILIYLIVARAIMSWFVRNPYGTLYRIYTVILQLTEPILQPFRRIISRFGWNGPIDFSPILAFIGLEVIRSVVIRLLLIIFY